MQPCPVQMRYIPFHQLNAFYKTYIFALIVLEKKTNLCNNKQIIIIINKPIIKTDVEVVIVISLNTNETGFEFCIAHVAIVSKITN